MAEEFEPADHCATVDVLGEIPRIDRRLLARIGRTNQHVTARQWPHLPWAASDPWKVFQHAHLFGMAGAQYDVVHYIYDEVACRERLAETGLKPFGPAGQLPPC